MDDPKEILGAIMAIILFVALLPVLFQMANLPYNQQLQQKEAEIKALKQEISLLNQQLEAYKKKYEQLRNETITKEDIEEIKQYFNTTQTQINLLNQKFDIVNNNFVTAYNTYFFTFTLSIFFNFVLAAYIALDLINLAFFNASLSMRIVNRLKVVLRRNK